jgi:hypothetical protein
MVTRSPPMYRSPSAGSPFIAWTTAATPPESIAAWSVSRSSGRVQRRMVMVTIAEVVGNSTHGLARS